MKLYRTYHVDNFEGEIHCFGIFDTPEKAMDAVKTKAFNNVEWTECKFKGEPIGMYKGKHRMLGNEEGLFIEEFELNKVC